MHADVRPDQPRIDAVDFYTRPGCGVSLLLRHRLRRMGVPLREIDIWADPDAAARVRSVTGGYETVPTVVVGRLALVNPTPGEVRDVVREHAPHLLPERTDIDANDDAGSSWLRRLIARLAGSR